MFKQNSHEISGQVYDNYLTRRRRCINYDGRISHRLTLNHRYCTKECQKNQNYKSLNVYERRYYTEFELHSARSNKSQLMNTAPTNLTYSFEKILKRPSIVLYLVLLILVIASRDAVSAFDTGNSEHFDGVTVRDPSVASSLNPLNFGFNIPFWVHFLQNDPPYTSTTVDSFTDDRSITMAPDSNTWKSIQNPLESDLTNKLDAHVRQILIPRVSGTTGNEKVRQYITNILKGNNYHVDFDEFKNPTPIGEVNFVNIIATSNPNACRQLVLACHYDSKMQEGFLGATDSAVPCAMLLNIAESFNKSFRNTDDPANDLGLMFIFFDGEEAFYEWSALDSLYGSRHLAAKWEKEAPPAHCKSAKNGLSKIELFVLLDLIGTSDTTFVMYNRNLKRHYSDMQNYEMSYLKKVGLAQTRFGHEIAFKNRFIPLDLVQDDHVPFKKRGVPILSLLAHPFPSVWHTINDNYSAIDYPRTMRILHVLEQFVSNYEDRKS